MAESTRAKKDFFISYTGNDETWALWIDDVLKNAGYTTILQARDFKAGANFLLGMHEAVENSANTIALFSKGYSESDFCNPELAATLVQDPTSRHSKLIPVRIDETYEPTGLLKAIRYIDLTKIENEGGTKEEKAKKAAQWLINEIKAVLEDIPIKREAPNPFSDGAKKREIEAAATLRQKTNLKFERNINFTGRENYLDEIEQSIQSKQNTLITQTITGLGGIGKTQLVVEYIYKYHSRYDLIWWFDADKEESIRQEYITLAERLGTTLQDKDQELACTLACLESARQKWLLVFDNADSIDPKQLKKLLPKVTESGHILITSRQKDWHGMNCEKISLDLWPAEEAREYLLKATPDRDGTNEDQAKALELSHLLGYLPLAIEQAAAYIDNENISIQKYIELFRDSSRSLEDCFHWGDQNDKNIATTWNLSFEKAKEQEEFTGPLSNLLAFFAPEGIPWERLFDGVFEKEKTGKAIAALARYNLLAKEQSLIFMHRMVQHVIREHLKTEDAAEKYIATVLEILSQKFLSRDEINSNEDLEFNKNLYFHGLHILQYPECRKASPENTGILLSNIGIYLYNQVGYYDEAIKKLQQALEMDREIGYKQGEASDLGNMGLLYHAKGDLDQALLYHKQALEMDREIGYKEGQANQLGNIGLIYRDKGNLDQALLYHTQALEMDRKIGYRQGEASNLGNIGLIYSAKGDLDQALLYHTQALEIDREIGYKQGEADQLGNIGVIYSAKGDLDQALHYLLLDVEIHREIGFKQVQANQLAGIGLIYSDKGDLDQALLYHTQALEIHREIGFKQGQADQLGNIGVIYSAKGDLDQALLYHTQALEMDREIGFKQGEASNLGNIGNIYGDKGDLDQSLLYLSQALEIHREIGFKQGEATQLGNIGLIYHAKGDLDQALLYLLQALEILESHGLSYGKDIIERAIAQISATRKK